MFFFDVFLGYKRKKTCKYCKSFFSGVEYGVRTHDLRNHNPTL